MKEAQRLACRDGVRILDAMYFELVLKQGECNPIPSDEDIREVIPEIVKEFKVCTQWTAIYRVLVDLCGWTAEIMSFYHRMESLLEGCSLSYPINYQCIQKTLASSSILRKHYKDWVNYKIKKDDRVFPKQLKIAQKLILLLAKNMKHTMREAETYDEG